mmetsp:Transcript_25283/g.35311  ORF Transcript_25283/g.35311 Transcript_25283/m.35311 type:complete len:226 (-) Transcript_25283:22-699(-)|eukprot:CAMPEP_0185253868 /NCGR_PEP_ID=MMETSP1359-20130426/2430_1 /TAXON_ID=552665 /ORGANISM="Bigelowiella longifila, Strain CCMP242" /LENGTH=225 /DNA_ID=CAMNT_0027836299 /DNA_START=156 /DNA_END=833 /DNA_ORIENTATION=-
MGRLFFLFKVSVDGKVVSKIGRGLMVLLGIKEGDTKLDMEYVCRKLLNMRLFDDDTGKPWKRSVMSAGLEVLVVSQFTLYCKLKGNKPDFHAAMNSSKSEPMYEEFLDLAAGAYRKDRISGGKFGAMMMVSLVNDGPVTIEICSDSVNHVSSKNKDNRKGASPSFSSQNKAANRKKNEGAVTDRKANNSETMIEGDAGGEIRLKESSLLSSHAQLFWAPAILLNS